MGYAIRTRRYRYVEWRVWNNGEVVARELYDYKTDASETENCIDKPQYAGPQKKLEQTLAAGWQEAKPNRLPR